MFYVGGSAVDGVLDEVVCEHCGGLVVLNGSIGSM